MRGDPTDNNATLFAQGYDAVLAPHFSSGWKNVGKTGRHLGPADRADRVPAAVHRAPEHQRACSSPNDENAAPIIHYLQTKGVKAKTFPVTGQDATLVGLQNILAGYQCGTVYKPIYLEAQAAAALAMYLRAGATPPSSLANGTHQGHRPRASDVPSVLLTPQWVTPSNMNATVIADNFVPASQLCTAKYKAACKAAGISG